MIATTLALSLLLTDAPPPLPDRVDLDTAVKMALSQTPGLAAVQHRQQAALAQADSLRGRLLPSVFVSDEQQHYDSPFAIAFGPASFVARDTNTNTFVAAADQPLTGLLHLTQDHAALTDAAEASQEQEKALEAAVREQVESGFLRYFEALALVEVARASEAQLTEQHNLAESRLKAGIITNADVLRIETAQANAKLQEVQAQSQADASQSMLRVTLGYPETTAVQFVEPTALVESVPALPDEPSAERQAVAARHEVAAAKLQISAADHQAQSSLYKLLPEADLEAAYTHIHGQIFAPPDSEFVGIKASWPIFTWGADWFAYQAARSNADAAALAAEDQSRSVRIDAAGKLAQLRATSSAVELAKTAIASAEEAYRVTNAQVRAGVATSTSDVLDAESALTQAKLALARAKYERAIAAMALKRAVGG